MIFRDIKGWGLFTRRIFYLSIWLTNVDNGSAINVFWKCQGISFYLVCYKRLICQPLHRIYANLIGSNELWNNKKEAAHWCQKEVTKRSKMTFIRHQKTKFSDYLILHRINSQSNFSSCWNLVFLYNRILFSVYTSDIYIIRIYINKRWICR